MRQTLSVVLAILVFSALAAAQQDRAEMKIRRPGEGRADVWEAALRLLLRNVPRDGRERGRANPGAWR